jgi:septal ring factor EnvC (AmiA/AmiB activator)
MGVSSNAPAGAKIHTVLSGWIIFAYTMSGTLAVLFLYRQLLFRHQVLS